ncbi:hypothetical protein DL764_008908 [Monosporascus ibericus]|uniref:CWH43-like N-terminal domain-containing protein n=1 Tax=Monosporascus ibericus TaxID=155417 RepID=A0A4V1X947_9PEZI|nr:hypothetical protein DL764_008908 [Monosporascus ibericus]
MFSYWILPVISGVIWLATLLGLLLHWFSTGRPHYESMAPMQNVAYISDVGAAKLKPLFVAGCIVTTIFLDLSFAADRFLRHRGRLVPNVSLREKVYFGLTIVFAIVGTVGLTCLSGFDTLHYPQLHNIFLVVFIVGYLLSAIFICAEFQRLGKTYRHHPWLRYSFAIKVVFILIEVGLLVGFGVATRYRLYDVPAILEWVIGFIFSFYIFSFVIDLLPAIHTGSGQPYSLRPTDTPEAREMRHGGRGPGHVDPRLTHDSQRTLTNQRHHHHGPAAPKPRTDMRDF